MRGKNILWLTLIGLLLSISIVRVESQTPADATIYLDPTFVYGYMPDDSFEVNIYIKDAVDVYSWSLELSYAPYMRTLFVAPGSITPGDFLAGRGPDYWFFADPFIDNGLGILKIGATLKYDITGVDGYGLLATVRFLVLEAGECPLDLYNTLVIDSNQVAYEVANEDSYYLGPTADLVPPNLPIKRPHGGGKEQAAWVHSMLHPWGTAYEMTAGVVNTGYADLYCRLKYVSVNQKTGQTYTFYSGQTMLNEITSRTAYLYVNEVIEIGDWTRYGTPPYMNAPDDGSYETGTEPDSITDAFGFEDITLSPVETITQVVLEGYTMAESLDIDIDAYDARIGTWYGSLWGEATWGWKNVRWTAQTMDQRNTQLRTKAGLNNLLVLGAYYSPTDPPVSLGIAALDCLRLKVTVQTGGIGPANPPNCVVGVGEVVTPDPAIWLLREMDVGKYITTITAQYMYRTPNPGFPQTWLEGPTTFTYEWWCTNP